MDFREPVNENQAFNYLIHYSSNLLHHRLHGSGTNSGPVGEVRNVVSVNILLQSEVA